MIFYWLCVAAGLGIGGLIDALLDADGNASGIPAFLVSLALIVIIGAMLLGKHFL